MSIKAIYESQEEIPENVRDLYEERDGKFELTGVEGVKTEEDVRRVQEGARKEREEHKKTRERLQGYEPLNPVLERYNNDPNELLAEIDRIDELKQAAEGKVDEDKLNEMADKRVKSKLAPVERELGQVKKERDELAEQNEQFQAKERQRTIHDAVRKAATGKKVVDTAMDDVLMLAERVFEVDDEGNVTTKDGVGVTPGIAADVWLTEMQDKRPHWWPQSQGGGAGGSGSGGGAGPNPFSAEGWNLTAQGQMVRDNPEKAEQMAKAAGTKVGGPKPPAKK